MNQAEIGYIFSFMGVMGALVQIFLLKIINKKLGEENTLILGCFIAIFGLGLIGFSTNLIFLLFVIVILSVGN
jgi:Na+/melibiose symporter-like transporter